MRTKLLCALLSGLLVSAIIYPASANNLSLANEDMALTIFGGVLEKGGMASALLASNLDRDSKMIGLGFSWRAFRWGNYLQLELEALLCDHFGSQDALEMGGLFYLRWLNFPWNNYVTTTMALGEGASYTDSLMRYEGTSDQGVERLLNLLIFEVTLGLPEYKQWALVLRAHHRSRAWGLYAGNGESNFFVFGLKYWF